MGASLWDSSSGSNPALREVRDDLRTLFPIWTGYLSSSWSQSVGKRACEQTRRSAHGLESRWLRLAGRHNPQALVEPIVQCLLDPVDQTQRAELAALLEDRL
jgi:hypothetical protein